MNWLGRKEAEDPEATRQLRRLRDFGALARDYLKRALEADEGKAADAAARYAKALEVVAEAQLVPAAGQEADKLRTELLLLSQQARDRLQTLQAACRRAAPRESARPTAARPSSSRAASSPAADPLRALIEAEILDRSPCVKFEDVAGLELAKQALREMVVLPAKRPDLFTGLRAPARGLLLFGPPGTGKTLLAKAVASEAASTFFSISAASLTSKWVGEGEKLVRALFAIAAERAPSVIFVDEIDSLLSARSATENEATRRLKTEFLVQMDGVGSSPKSVVLIGATNRPEELDEAVRRRLVKRILIPLPDRASRAALLSRLLTGEFALPRADAAQLVTATEGYSGSDLAALCKEAAMVPLRELGAALEKAPSSTVRALTYADFQASMRVIRPSVAPAQLHHFTAWDREFGSHG